jgi:hypothetical protein
LPVAARGEKERLMAATSRFVSPLSWRPASRVLAAAFAGSAVMFGAAVMQDRAPLPAGTVAGPLPGATATPPPSPRPAAPPQGSAVPAAAGAGAPGAAPRADVTAVPPSPASPGTPEVRTAPDAAGSRIAPWTPGALPDWEARLRALMERRTATRSAPAPAVPAQEPPAPGDTGRPGGGPLGELLDALGAGH